jgi:hypothetical protein
VRKKPLSYQDAVVLLGGDSKIFAALSKVAGGALSVASLGSAEALSLIGLKDEVERLGQDAVVTLRNRWMGLNRFSRSELIEAAHAVLVVSAFFTALDDLSVDLRAALSTTSLQLSAAEQAILATQSAVGLQATDLADLAREFLAPGAIPGVSAGWTGREGELAGYYRRLSLILGSFAVGTAAWDENDETTLDRWSQAIANDLPGRAVTRYEEFLARLAGEFPEFAFWANRIGVKAILDELAAARLAQAGFGSTLDSVAALLRPEAGGTALGRLRADLATAYRRQLSKPIGGSAAAEAQEGVTIPPLQELYVAPSCRFLPSSRSFTEPELVSEETWRMATSRHDLWSLVVEHLISTAATGAPMVLFGQPGAGKSVFTQMLAAELDPQDYLVIRVELRDVPSDADVQKQIEAGLRTLTGRNVEWPDLLEDLGHAQPVVILDGFDELLQASGMSHFDFLERVQAFQDREADLGRPTTVLVTSRVAVANQVRYPNGTVIARVEEFDDEQVGRWLEVWNAVNSGAALPLETALAQGELARQPLLLFLLALFQASGGALSADLGQAQLYEQLFTRFVRRDVLKTEASLSESEQKRAIARELDLLSMVAISMFNRGHQTLSEASLVADLTALKLTGPADTIPAGHAAALNIAERMAGRFFFRLFMQRDQARLGQQTLLSTYEFLHASFGEFLVARWVAGELRRLAERARLTGEELYPPPPDDRLLRALLSVAALSGREQRVLGFLTELLAGLGSEMLSDIRKLLATLFHGCLQSGQADPYPSYRPVMITGPAAYAAYSANLLLLLLLVAGQVGEDVTLPELYTADQSEDGSSDLLSRFYAVTRLWHSQLSDSDWGSLLAVIHLDVRPDPARTDGRQETRVVFWNIVTAEGNSRALLPRLGYPSSLALWPAVRLDDSAGRALREASLLGSVSYQGACAALLPYLKVSRPTQWSDTPLSLGDEAADMLSLFLGPLVNLSVEQRVEQYVRLLGYSPSPRLARLLLDRLRGDLRQIPAGSLVQITDWAYNLAWTNALAYFDLEAFSGEIEADSTSEEPKDTVGIQPMFDRVRVAFNADDPANVRDVLELIQPSGSAHGVKERTMSFLQGFEVDSDRDDDRDTAVRELLVLHDVLGTEDLEDLVSLVSPPGYPRLVGEIAEWLARAERGLRVSEPQKLHEPKHAAILQNRFPGFVARTRRLVDELGFVDPISAGLAAAGPDGEPG